MSLSTLLRPLCSDGPLTPKGAPDGGGPERIEEALAGRRPDRRRGGGVDPPGAVRRRQDRPRGGRVPDGAARAGGVGGAGVRGDVLRGAEAERAQRRR